MLERLKTFSQRYGWGLAVAAAPYVNLALLATTGLAIFLLIVLLQSLGISIEPDPRGGILGSLFYVLFMVCYGWYAWSWLITFALVPIGFAWSLTDLLTAKATNRGEQFIGAVAGLALSGIPLFLYIVSALQSRY